jgi:GTPase SAR1 family protein
MSAALRIAVAGNPNVGKTSLFNLLTGSRYKVGNYPGVTVETREGRLRGGHSSSSITLVDLPGTYSLTPLAEDEAVAFRTLTGTQPVGAEANPHAGRRPDAVLLVLDASNLARNLYLALQLFELGLPIIVALNMIARRSPPGRRRAVLERQARSAECAGSVARLRPVSQPAGDPQSSDRRRMPDRRRTPSRRDIVCRCRRSGRPTQP